MKKQTIKLGKDTGSLVNGIMGNNRTEPKVGAGATVLSWSDRHAYEVIEVSADGKRAIIQQYRAKRIDANGMSECQTWEYKELYEHKQVVLWRNNAWRYEIQQVVFIDDNTPYNAEYFDGVHLKLIPGITKIAYSYPKVNILWGVKDEYYDFSF